MYENIEPSEEQPPQAFSGGCSSEGVNWGSCSSEGMSLLQLSNSWPEFHVFIQVAISRELRSFSHLRPIKQALVWVRQRGSHRTGVVVLPKGYLGWLFFRRSIILMYYTFRHGPYMLIASQAWLVFVILLDRTLIFIIYSYFRGPQIDLFKSR